MSASLLPSPAANTTTVRASTKRVPFPTKFRAKESVNVACWRLKAVSNGSRARCMKTWNPMNNKRYETLSYLPPLTPESIAKQVEYMVSKGWVPCLEFDEIGEVRRTNSQIPGYYDGRYWTLWKLPMFGCTDASQVLNEIEECKKTYPNAYIRLLSFDNKHQCQCMSFVIQKPTTIFASTFDA